MSATEAEAEEGVVEQLKQGVDMVRSESCGAVHFFVLHSIEYH